MTTDEFAAVTADRIPTPAEFVAFAVAQGWRLVARDDGTASLRADKGDGVAVAFARVLAREPYRTGVLELVAVKPAVEVPAAAEPAATEQPKPPPVVPVYLREPRPPRPSHTRAGLLAAHAAGRWVSVLLPGGAVCRLGEDGWEAGAFACVAGGPWVRIEPEVGGG